MKFSFSKQQKRLWCANVPAPTDENGFIGQIKRSKVSHRQRLRMRRRIYNASHSDCCKNSDFCVFVGERNSFWFSLVQSWTEAATTSSLQGRDEEARGCPPPATPTRKVEQKE